ncbi:MAG: sulfurtransferase [Chromatiales bacterium]
MYTTLIDRDALRAVFERPDVAIVDCRFELGDTEAGRRAYLQAHVPGAVYAHLDEDLSARKYPGSGRHPLPSPGQLAKTFSCWGIAATTQVVAYDAAGGMLAAARLWWLLRYMGHEATAVLDGGWAAWTAAGLPVASGSQGRVAAAFCGRPRGERLVTVEEVPRVPRLIDSRDPARYRGESEPIDPVAGHIPGAMNYFCQNNLGDGGRFRDRDQLRALLEPVYDLAAPQTVTFYCGSGVTACHNILAVLHAGYPEPRLYAGSWSEWCADPTHAVAVGME